MYTLNFAFAILLFLQSAFNLVYCELAAVQDEMPNLEKALDMAAILLSGNLEDEIVKLQSRKIGSLPVTFENIYAELDRGEIILLKPTLKHLRAAILKQTEIKLERNHLTVSAEWYNVTVYASYESHYERGTAPAIRIDGQLSFRWNWIKAQGPVGLAASIDSLKTQNNDLSYVFGDLNLDIVDHNSEHIAVDAIINACENIAPKLYWDLVWELRSSLEMQLDGVLKISNTPRQFQSLKDFHDYRISSERLTNGVNLFVDGFLESFRAVVIHKEFQWIPLRAIQKSVDTKLGIVSFQGDFSAVNGSAGDLSTIKRVGDFSIWTIDNNEEIELSGLANFTNFSAKYFSYKAMASNFKVMGNISILTTSNLLELKITLIREPRSKFGYKVLIRDVKVVRLGHLAVELTGMGALNKFVSLLATMVLNHFKADLVQEINKNLELAIKPIAKQYWTL